MCGWFGPGAGHMFFPFPLLFTLLLIGGAIYLFRRKNNCSQTENSAMTRLADEVTKLREEVTELKKMQKDKTNPPL